MGRNVFVSYKYADENVFICMVIILQGQGIMLMK